jgi:hypothetical protein
MEWQYLILSQVTERWEHESNLKFGTTVQV